MTVVKIRMLRQIYGKDKYLEELQALIDDKMMDQTGKIPSYTMMKNLGNLH